MPSRGQEENDPATAALLVDFRKAQVPWLRAGTVQHLRLQPPRQHQRVCPECGTAIFKMNQFGIFRHDVSRAGWPARSFPRDPGKRVLPRQTQRLLLECFEVRHPLGDGQRFIPPMTNWLSPNTSKLVTPLSSDGVGELVGPDD